MNKKLIKIFVIMTLLVLILGVLLHFAYEWSDNNPLIGAFSSVNESTWEHLKLVYFPMLVFGVLGYLFIRNISNNFIEGLTIGILVSLIFIVIFFYVYQAIVEKNVDFLNILDFILAVIIGEFAFYKIVSMENSSSVVTRFLCLAILTGLFICFVVFTYFPLEYRIFVSPV